MNAHDTNPPLPDDCRRFRETASVAHLESCPACEEWLTGRLRSIAAASAVSETASGASTAAGVTPAQAVWRARHPRPVPEGVASAPALGGLRAAAAIAVLGVLVLLLVFPKAPTPEENSLLARISAPPSEVWLFPPFDEMPPDRSSPPPESAATDLAIFRDDDDPSDVAHADLGSALRSSGRLCAALDRSLVEHTNGYDPWNLEGGL